MNKGDDTGQMPVTIEDIGAAADRITDGITDGIYASPCPVSEPLSRIAGC